MYLSSRYLLPDLPLSYSDGGFLGLPNQVASDLKMKCFLLKFQVQFGIFSGGVHMHGKNANADKL